MYVCTYVCMYVSMYVCMYVSMYLCMYVCICHMNKYTCMCTNNKWHKHLIQIIFCISPCWKWDLKHIWKIFMGLGYPSRAARASIFAGILVDANALKSHNAWRTVRTTTPDCPLSAQRWQISRKNCSAKRLVNATEGKKRTHTHTHFFHLFDNLRYGRCHFVKVEPAWNSHGKLNAKFKTLARKFQ